jgi:putative transposase
MAEFDVTLSEGLMPSILQRPEGLRDLIASVLNQVLEAQLAEHLNADRYERNEERSGHCQTRGIANQAIRGAANP